MKVTKIPKTREKSIYEKKLNVAAYVRVSTLSESQQISFNSQYEYYKDRINKISEWNFVGIYADDGISGKKDFNRTSFMSMIDDALNGKIDLILIKSISRFSRNTVDSLKYIRLLKSNGIGIIFEEENISTLNIGGELLISIFSSIAQIENENLSSRIKYGIMMLAENGNYSYSQKPFGYKYIPSKRKIVVNKKEAEVVKLVYKLCIDGLAVRKIADYLNEKGYIKTKKWGLSNVYNILTNKKYYGVSTITIDSKRYLEDNIYPKIITKEIYNLANKELKSRKQEMIKTRDFETIFVGKLKCGLCYKNLISRKNRKKWSCVDMNCTRHSYKEKMIYDCFDFLIKEILKIDYRFKDSFKLRKLQEELEMYKIQIDKVVDDYIDKKINYKKFNIEQEKILNRIVIVENNIDFLNKQKQNLKIYRNFINNLRNKIINNYNDKNKLFNEIVSRVYIHMDKKLRYLNIKFILDQGFNHVHKEVEYYLKNTYVLIIKKFMKYDYRINTEYETRKKISKIRITYNVREEELNGSRSYKKEIR